VKFGESNKKAEKMKIGISADHGGFEFKEKIAAMLNSQGYNITDYGAHKLDDEDDYPDFVIPMAQALAKGEIERGIAICGSGVGACIAANKVPGVRAALIHESFSAHQGVEDDDMNVICLGGRVIDYELAWNLIQTFLKAQFSGAVRHQRRLAKIAALDKQTD
jgi:RpiB/LacA/LacB family sugar-phosphate isomerase